MVDMVNAGEWRNVAGDNHCLAIIRVIRGKGGKGWLRKGYKITDV